jgi:cytochrome c553
MRIVTILAALVLGLASLAPAFAQAFLQPPAEGDEQGAPEEPTGAKLDPGHGQAIATKGVACDGGSECFPCFQCHGEDGAGDPSANIPRLSGQSYFYLYDSLRAFAEGTRPNPIMQQVASALDDQAMRDVSAYYALVKPETNLEAAADAALSHPDPEALVRGGVLASVGDMSRGIQACVNCHGPNGIGLPPVYPFLAGQYAQYLEDALMAWKRGERGGDPLDIMRNIAQRMTDQEIRDVSQYFAAVRPVTHPEQGLVPSGSEGEQSAQSRSSEDAESAQ